MPTDKPKISAYVPHRLKVAVEGFAASRKISESQAVTIILAEYFQIEIEINRSNVGGVTLSKVQELEERIKQLEDKSTVKHQQLSLI